MPVRLWTLGSPRCYVNDREISALSSQAVLFALFIYLTVERRSSRDAVLSIFWPERDPEGARHLLEQSLRELREFFDDPWLDAEGDFLTVRSTVELDAETFQLALERGAPALALELYKGPFLDGFYLPKSKSFESWVERQRARLAHLHRAARRDAGSGLQRLFSELKRRHVTRVGVMYCAFMFVAIQAADLVFPVLLLPAWAYRLLVISAIVGLPVTLVLAWVLDITPHGIERTASPGGVGEAIIGASRLRQVIALGALMLGVLALFGWWSFSQEEDTSAAAVPHAGRSDTMAADPRAIAVLPFDNLSAERSNEYFTDGITEDILINLSRNGRLRVISRSSVMQYKNTRKSAREIGQELHVGSVLEGSVRRSGNRVRIAAQLNDAGTNHQIWAESYDRSLTDVFAIQSEIAQKIASALDAQLSTSESTALQRPPTRSLTAYDFYLKGRAYARSDLNEQRNFAIGLFRRALELDPRYALAYNGLAEVFYERYRDGGQRMWLDSARVTVNRALAIDPGLQEAVVELMRVYWSMGDRQKYRNTAQRAAALNPSSALGLEATSHVMLLEDRVDEALRMHQQMVSLDPTNALHYVAIANDYLDLGLFDDARRWAQRALEIQPDLFQAKQALIMGELVTGQLDSAERRARLLTSSSPGRVRDTWWLTEVLVWKRDYAAASRNIQAYSDAADPHPGYVYWQLGDHARAQSEFAKYEKILRERIRQGDIGGRYSLFMAMLFAVKGEKDAAYRWLQSALDAGWDWDYFEIQRPYLDNLRGDARFQQMLAPARARTQQLQQRVRLRLVQD